MELTKLLTNDKNYELIPKLEDMILEFKVNLQYKFWEELKEGILRLTEVKDLHKTHSKDQIRHFYSMRSRDRWVDQKFHLKSANWNSYDVGLETGVYRDKEIYFGFMLLENGEQVHCCTNKEFDDLVEILGNEFKREENW